MKMTVLLVFGVLTLALADPNEPTQIEKYRDKLKTYTLDVPGKEPIKIIEMEPEERRKWKDTPVSSNRDEEIKNLLTHIVYDVNGNRPRCYGPSCQDGFDGEAGPNEELEEFVMDHLDKMKNYQDFSQDRLQAISALAAKLKKEKLKADRFSSPTSEESDDDEDDNNGKVYTTWNRLKVKQHKHPYDDKDGWVTLEPVAWSTSKISKWKPNVKKQNHYNWNDEDDKFPNDDRFNSYPDNNYQYPTKRPTVSRPSFINNKPNTPTMFDTEIPSKPSWSKPSQKPYSHNLQSYPHNWAPDEGRRPHKPNCDSEENYPNDDTVFYGISDSVVTDPRPANFPYEYEALHPATNYKRPLKRPTQVVYAGSPDFDSDRGSRPPYGDGQWVLLSTTKGYRNKKRQRSLNQPTDNFRTEQEYPTIKSHQAVALTVLPIDKAHTNMTTSHGGLLEVEKSFQTVEESKLDMDKMNDLGTAGSVNRPVVHKGIKKKVINMAPDSSTVLAAVGAGMLPATMAMVVPMMLGRRRKRNVNFEQEYPLNIFEYRQK